MRNSRQQQQQRQQQRQRRQVASFLYWHTQATVFEQEFEANLRTNCVLIDFSE